MYVGVGIFQELIESMRMYDSFGRDHRCHPAPSHILARWIAIGKISGFPSDQNSRGFASPTTQNLISFHGNPLNEMILW